MKGYIFDIKKFAIHDGPGIRTTVFLKGCPLRCWWCHNPESHKILPETISVDSSTNECDITGNEVSVEDVMHEILKDRIFYEDSGGGVTFSGGEPLSQIKFLKELLLRSKEEELHTIVDTSGFAKFESFESIYDLTDLFFFDLKIIDKGDHLKYTGVFNDVIFENLTKLNKMGKKTVIRVPLIPGYTDTDKNLDDLSKLISKLKNLRRIDLLPYNKISESKYARFNKESKLINLQTQTEQELSAIKNKFSTLGLEVNIRG